MNEFKFNCPKCGQHILANAAWIGRRIDCPSCNTHIDIPAPAKPPKKKESAAVAPADKKAKLPGDTSQGKPSVKADKTVPAPAKAVQKTEPATGTPMVVKATPPAETLRVEPPVRTGGIGEASAKLPKPTAPATALPSDAKGKLPSDTLRVKPPAKTDQTGLSPAKAAEKSELPTVAPTVVKPTPPVKATLATETLRVEPPVKTDRAGDAPAKVPTPTAPATVAPADKKPKPSVATLRLDAPDKADDTGVPPTKALKKDESVAGAPEVEKAEPVSPTMRAGPPVKADKSETAPAPTSQPTPSAAEAGKPEATPPQVESEVTPDTAKPLEQPRVAVLTPAVKLDMVRAVRRRIAKESAWLPGKVEGAPAYAAKLSEGKPVLLDATNSEATRFSLMGAFLLEMHARQVITVATGRKRFLDEEIPEAIREVLLEQMDDEEREHGEDSLAGKDLLSISHAQCLATLDVLEERYSQRMDQLRIEKARKRLGTERLPDLVKKLEKKARILPEDVATALYHELMEVRRRLERLENRISEKK